MEVMPEANAVMDAIEANNSARLVTAVKEYARLTRNPHNDEKQIWLGPSIPIGPGIRVHNGEYAENEETPQDEKPQDGLQSERLWLQNLFYNTGNECQRKRRYELALVCYQEAAKYKLDPSVINNMAVVYKRMGNYTAAVECHQRNLAEFPGYVPAYGRLAIVLSAYGCSSERSALEYLKMYFDKGGNRTQLQAFVTGLPSAEAQALDSLLGEIKAEKAMGHIGQHSKKKLPKQYKDRFGRI